MKLTAENISTVLRDCLFRDEEIPTGNRIPENAIKVEGITMRFGFHPGRIEAHKEDIESLLMQLPHQFRASEGGGWSFLNACITDQDPPRQWGEQVNVQELMVLGVAANLVSVMPREMWHVLPGGVPYFTVLDKEV